MPETEAARSTCIDAGKPRMPFPVPSPALTARSPRLQGGPFQAQQHRAGAPSTARMCAAGRLRAAASLEVPKGNAQQALAGGRRLQHQLHVRQRLQRSGGRPMPAQACRQRAPLLQRQAGSTAAGIQQVQRGRALGCQVGSCHKPRGAARGRPRRVDHCQAA